MCYLFRSKYMLGVTWQLIIRHFSWISTWILYYPKCFSYPRTSAIQSNRCTHRFLILFFIHHYCNCVLTLYDLYLLFLHTILMKIIYFVVSFYTTILVSKKKLKSNVILSRIPYPKTLIRKSYIKFLEKSTSQLCWWEAKECTKVYFLWTYALLLLTNRIVSNIIYIEQSLISCCIYAYITNY